VEKAITLDHVVKKYGDKVAVDGVNVTIEQGTIVALLGPNGAGKTTAISMMLGLVKPSQGQVAVYGQSPLKASTRKHFGVMLQQVSLPAKLQVRELIDLFRSYYEQPLSVETLLRIADLESVAKRECVKLSGGQQRRLQFALAMAGDPKIVFLDEPTTGMDVAARRGFWDNLRDFANKDGRTIILTTHHLDEADAIADRILLMQNGRVTADGTVEEIKRQAGNRYVAFVAGPGVTASEIEALPHVDHAEWSGRHVRLRTSSPDELLRTIIRLDLDVSQFEITQGHLEDAFISLTETSDATVGGIRS
jgi:ABC-2 type transport system ATP-binding protein